MHRSKLGRSCQLHTTKRMEGTSFLRRIFKKGHSMKRLAYTTLARPILEYGAVCWDPHREGQVSALNRVRRKATKFANDINGSGGETLAQRRLITRIFAPFKAHTEGRAWKAIGDRLLKPLTRDIHLMQHFIYYYKQLYIFRASICPSSEVLGCILIILLHMVSITRCCG